MIELLQKLLLQWKTLLLSSLDILSNFSSFSSFRPNIAAAAAAAHEEEEEKKSIFAWLIRKLGKWSEERLFSHFALPCLSYSFFEVKEWGFVLCYLLDEKLGFFTKSSWSNHEFWKVFFRLLWEIKMGFFLAYFFSSCSSCVSDQEEFALGRTKEKDRYRPALFLLSLSHKHFSVPYKERGKNNNNNIPRALKALSSQTKGKKNMNYSAKKRGGKRRNNPRIWQKKSAISQNAECRGEGKSGLAVFSPILSWIIYPPICPGAVCCRQPHFPLLSSSFSPSFCGKSEVLSPFFLEILDFPF